MQIMRITCNNCAGVGSTMKYEIVGDGVTQGKKTICESCNGQGYTEHVAFSIEEGKAILKYCGLSTES